MRLNKSTYPAYMALESGNHYSLQMDAMFGDLFQNEHQIIGFMDNMNAVYRSVMPQKKYFMTEPFREAIERAIPKLVEKGAENTQRESGIIFTAKGFVLYACNPSPDKKFVLYGFARTALTTYGYVHSNGECYGLAASSRNGEPYNDTEMMYEILYSYQLAVYFINNCEVETKVLTPNTKHRADGVKYFNESRSNITILDCRWFTELIREAPFHVNGHLRWQACGEKFSKRKLTWVSEYQKQGYRRKAQKVL